MKSKISLVITTYNEAESIQAWCLSVLDQTVLPDEVIIVDSKSSDGTVNIVKSMFCDALFELILISEKCNISKGRNIAIRSAQNEFIAITDGGVILNNNWLELILSDLFDHDVVAGYYDYSGDLIIQKVYRELYYTQPDDVNPQTFLPSSRSLGIKKSVWESVNGYNERFVIGEDTDFDLKILKQGFDIKFNPKAIVRWATRDSLKSIIIQQFKYSYWDAIIGQNVKGHMLLSLYSFMFVLSLVLIGVTSDSSLFIFISFFIFISPILIKFIKRKLSFSDVACKVLVVTGCILAKGVGFICGIVMKPFNK